MHDPLYTDTRILYNVISFKQSSNYLIPVRFIVHAFSGGIYNIFRKYTTIKLITLHIVRGILHS